MISDPPRIDCPSNRDLEWKRSVARSINYLNRNNFRSYKAVGDEITNNDIPLQNAINAGITDLYVEGGSYRIESQALFDNITNLRIYGEGTFYLATQPAEFEFVGDCSNLTFEGLKFRGPGTDWASPNAVLGCFSGTTLDKIRLIDLEFSDLPFGVHLNADLSGSIQNPYMRNLRFTNMVGTASGHGLGLVLSGPLGRLQGGQVINCFFERCNRHALYCSSASGVSIVGTTFSKHRYGLSTTDTPFYSALNIARSAHVTVDDCQFNDNNDLCVQLYQDDGSGLQDCVGLSVLNSTFTGSTFRDILIGADTPNSPIYPLRGVKVLGNRIFKNGVNNVGAIYYQSGTMVEIGHNYIEALAQTGVTSLMTIDNWGDTTRRSGDVRVFRNDFKALGTGTPGDIRCITPTAQTLGGTQIFKIYDNGFDIGAGDSDIFYPAAITNPNFSYTA